MKKNSKATRTTKYDHPGRPRHALKWPKSKQFTFTDIMDANGCDTRPGKNFGKAPNEDGCTMLTVRKNLKADMYILHPKTKKIQRVNPRSQVVLVKGVTADPNSESGLGRKALLYCLRINKDSIKMPTKTSTPKATRAPRKARTPANTSQTPTADALDKIHAALAAPSPAPVTVPAVTIAPEATPAPAPAPVAPAPAPAPEAAPAAAVEVAPAPAPAPVLETVPVSTLVNS